MTGQQIPPDLEQITKYIRRAEELTNDETSPKSRLVAYSCRQYAVKLGTPLATDPDCEAALAIIVDAIDADKDAMEKFTKEEVYATCLSLAMEVFNKADAEDRAGETGNETANNFSVAASYLDVLKQFTEEESGRGEEAATEEEKKSFYAKRRAASISKAIEEGLELTPGGYNDANADSVASADGGGGEEEVQNHLQTNATPLFSMREEAGSGEQSETPPIRVERQRSARLGRAATFDHTPPAYPSIQSVNSMPAKVRSYKSKKPPLFGKIFSSSPPISPTDVNPANSQDTDIDPASSLDTDIDPSGKDISREAMKTAKALAKYAIKALEMKDTQVAVKRLKEAFEVLTQP